MFLGGENKRRLLKRAMANLESRLARQDSSSVEKDLEAVRESRERLRDRPGGGDLPDLQGNAAFVAHASL